MSGERDVPEKVHSELGASVASRWMACPGSVQLSRTVPVPATTSFAQEGTAAHALSELCLRNRTDPTAFLGMALEGVEVTEDMVDHVRVYVEHCRSVALTAQEFWTERRFNLAGLNPPAPMFGTADFVAYDAELRELTVVDLKYGQGVVVEAKGNPQLRYYALGAALSVFGVQIDTVTMTIVQPRAAHVDGPIRSETIDYMELLTFANELMDAARATLAPDAPLNAGSHCRFCPASGVCPAQSARAQLVAQSDFSVAAPVMPPAPSTIPPEQFAEMLSKLHILEDWASAMRAYAQAALERGEDVPGFKLVERRATRKWIDEEGVVALLKGKGFADEEIYKQDVKSPAQVEKLLGKKSFGSELAGNVVKKSSGYNMVPTADARPAVTLTPGSEFLALAAGTPENTEAKQETATRE